MMRQAHDQGHIFGFKNDILMNHNKSKALDDIGENDEAKEDPFGSEPASILELGESDLNNYPKTQPDKEEIKEETARRNMLI